MNNRLANFKANFKKSERVEDNSMPSVSRSVTKNRTKHGLGVTTGDNIYLAMLDYLRTLEHSGITRVQGETFGDQSTMTIDDVEVELSAVEHNQGATDENITQARAILSFRSMASQILLDLCTVHKVGKLTAAHITSYFAQKGDVQVGADKFKQRIVRLSQYIPNAVDDEELRANLTDSSWMTYRLSFSATPALIVKAIEVVDAFMPQLFTGQERNLAANCVRESSNRVLNAEISQTTIMKTYVILESADLLPKSWIQGDKAMKNCTVKSIKAMRDIAKTFKQIVDVDTSSAKITNLEDLRKFGVVNNLVVGNADRAAMELRNIVVAPKMRRGVMDTQIMWFEDNKMIVLIIAIVIAFLYDRFFR